MGVNTVHSEHLTQVLMFLFVKFRWPLKIPLLRLCVILCFMYQPNLTCNWDYMILFFFFFPFFKSKKKKKKKIIYPVCDFLWWDKKSISFSSLSVCHVIQDVNTTVWRWIVHVVPLILLNVRLVCVCVCVCTSSSSTECFFYCTRHWLDAWSGGSNNPPVRVN